MSSWVDDSGAPDLVRSAFQNLGTLGENYVGSTDRLMAKAEELAAPEVFGNDNMGRVMRENYPDVVGIFKNRKEIGEGLIDIAKNGEFGMDVYNETDRGLAQDAAAVDVATETHHRRR